MKIIKIEILKRGYATSRILVNGQIVSVPTKYIKEIHDPISDQIEHFCYVTEEPGQSDIRVDIPINEIIEL